VVLEDVSVTEPVAEEFTVTLPKLRAEALSVNCVCACRPGFADAVLADVPNRQAASQCKEKNPTSSAEPGDSCQKQRARANLSGD